MIILRYLAKNFYTYFLFVFIGFIGLFVILDFISESKEINNQYTYAWAMGQVLLRTIYYLYQFIPIAALIACVLATVKLSQQSEFIIMRMHGLSLFKILKLFGLLSIPLVIFTFSLGEYLVPLSARVSQEIKQRLLQKTHLDLKSGFWLKYQPKNSDSQYFIRITHLNPTNNLGNFSVPEQQKLQTLQQQSPQSRFFAYIYLYEFSKSQQYLKNIYFANYASIAKNQNTKNINLYLGRKINVVDLDKKLDEGDVSKHPNHSNDIDSSQKNAAKDSEKAPENLFQKSDLNATTTAPAALIPMPAIEATELNNPLNNLSSHSKITPFQELSLDFELPPGFIEYLGMKNKARNMTIKQLREYITFLKNNQQTSHEYELSLWQKYVYPATNLMMLWLGAVFIYFKQRQTKQAYIFVVIISGLLMYLGQTILLQIAQLKTWHPPVVAGAPIILGLALMLFIHIYLQKK